MNPNDPQLFCVALNQMVDGLNAISHHRRNHIQIGKKKKIRRYASTTECFNPCSKPVNINTVINTST